MVTLALGLGGCQFDRSGPRPRDHQTSRDGAGDLAPAPDLLAGERLQPDLSVADLRADRRPLDRAPPSDQHLQGTTCKDQGYSFNASQAPTAGATLNLEVVGASKIWVLGGVGTSTKDILWKPKTQNSGSAPVTWTFVGVTIPNKPGPFLFGFMVDAEDDDPENGTLRASCTP